MDLNLYGRVLRRHWRLVLPGVVLAIALATLSFVRVSADGIAYRQPAVYQSQSLLLLTQSGFPYVRAPVSGRAEVRRKVLSSFRLAALTELYAKMESSDEVRRMMRRAGAPKTWKIVSEPILPRESSSALPIVGLAGQAFSEKDAERAAAYGTRAFIEYVKKQQDDAAIPAAERIGIQVLRTSSTPTPTVVKPVGKTLPLMVFLAVLTATLGLAFILENRSPHIRVVASTADDDDVDMRPADGNVRRWG